MFMKNPFGSSQSTGQTNTVEKSAKNYNLELTLKLSKDQKSQMKPGTSWKEQAIVYLLPESNGGGFLLEEAWIAPQMKRNGNGKWSRHTAIYDHPLFDGEDVIFNQFQKLEAYKKQFKYGSQEYKEASSKAYQWKYKKLLCLEVMDFTEYHMVPNVSNSQYSTPYVCQGARCPFCNDNNPEISKKHFGGRRILPLTENEYAELKRVNMELGSIVARATTPEIIGKTANPGVVAIKCPSCEHDLVDPNQVKTMKMELVESYLSQDSRCSNCGHQGKPMEVSLHGEEVIARGSVANHPILITRSGVLGKQGSGQFNISFAGLPAKDIEALMADRGIDEFQSFIGNHIREEVNISNYFAPEGVTPSFYGWDDSAPADQQPNFRSEEYKAEVLRRRSTAIGDLGPSSNPQPPKDGGFSFYRR